MSHALRTRSRPSVVIVGAGFAGLAAARELARAEADVTVIDRRNYHLFQPLLYQVATAALSPADIAWPIRRLLGSQANARVLMARVTGIDTAKRRVLMEDGRGVPYDWLILATGARHAYFGRDEWAAHAPGLKKIDDATDIRRRVLWAFEAAEQEDDRERRRALMTFVVVGAGPTGAEMAGAIAELARHALVHDFRRIDPGAARVILAEAGSRVLPSFDPVLSDRAAIALDALGVEVACGNPVTAVDPQGVLLGNRRIDAATVIWAAGVMASPAAKWLGAPADRAGRLIVAGDLSVPGFPGVYATGDTVAVTGPDGMMVPGVAPAAKQMGAHAARLITRRIDHRSNESEPFRYRDHGAMATIGRGAAVAEIAGLKLSGHAAWLLWAAAHIYFLIGARNRIVVSTNWLWTYLTGARGGRLITGQPPAHSAAVASDPGLRIFSAQG